MTKATRYFLRDPPAKVRLMKLNETSSLGYRFRDGKWVEEESVYGMVTGFSGDSNWEEITAAEAEAYKAKGEE